MLLCLSVALPCLSQHLLFMYVCTCIHVHLTVHLHLYIYNDRLVLLILFTRSCDCSLDQGHDRRLGHTGQT